MDDNPLSSLLDALTNTPCCHCRAVRGKPHKEGCPRYKITLKEYILSHGVIKTGNFTLRSGKQSDWYFQASELTMRPVGLRLVVEGILEKLYEMDVDAVGGPELGAVPIAAGLTALSGRPLTSFVVRKPGPKQRVEGPLECGMRVAVIEDVTTTGEAALEAANTVRTIGLVDVVAVITVCDRQEGAEELFKKEGIPFHWLFRRDH